MHRPLTNNSQSFYFMETPIAFARLRRLLIPTFLPGTVFCSPNTVAIAGFQAPRLKKDYTPMAARTFRSFCHGELR